MLFLFTADEIQLTFYFKPLGNNFFRQIFYCKSIYYKGALKIVPLFVGNQSAGTYLRHPKNLKPRDSGCIT